MRILFIVCVFVCISLSLAAKGKGCRRALSRCIEDCPVGTHEYNSACKALYPEPTCKNPNPKTDQFGSLCDFSACYCDPPKVRDEKVKSCVRLEECSK